MKLEFIDIHGHKNIIKYDSSVWVCFDTDGRQVFSKYTARPDKKTVENIQNLVPTHLQSLVRILLKVDEPTVLQRKLFGIPDRKGFT